MGFRVRPSAGAGIAGMALLSSLALAVVFGWNRILSGSADITYHLQVLDAVRHGGFVPASARAYMGEMFGYPDLGHRVAAAGTWLGLSDLNALTLTGVFCAALVWFCLLDQARRAGVFVLIAGGLLAVAAAALTRISFGAEIVSNFFYSQMFGEAFALTALVLGQPLLARSRSAYGLFSVLAVAVCGCTHLIPTVHLAGASMAVLGVEGLRELIRKQRIDLSVAGGIAAVALAVVANPYTWNMRILSSHDGVVGYGIDFGFIELAVAETTLLGLSAWVLIARALDPEPPASAERAAVLLAALGAAVAAAGLVQMVSFLLLGEASIYAVKKQAFGVASLLCFVLPTWLLGLARQKRPSPAWSLALVVAAQIAIIAALFARPSVLEVPAVDKLLADARALRLARGQERTDILFASGQVPPLVSYVVGSAALRRKRDEAAADVLAGGVPLDIAKVARIATPVGDVYDKPACREGAPMRGLVVVNAACAALPAAVFRAGGNGAAYLTEGWGTPEAGAVWSLGKWGVVDLPIPEEARRYRSPYVEITLFGFVPPQSPERRIWITVADDPPEPHRVLAVKRPRLILAHPLTSAQMAKGTVRVVFEVENPVAPAALGLGDDRRLLGIGLEKIRILPQAQ